MLTRYMLAYALLYIGILLVASPLIWMILRSFINRQPIYQSIFENGLYFDGVPAALCAIGIVITAVGGYFLWDSSRDIRSYLERHDIDAEIEDLPEVTDA